MVEKSVDDVSVSVTVLEITDVMSLTVEVETSIVVGEVSLGVDSLEEAVVESSVVNVSVVELLESVMIVEEVGSSVTVVASLVEDIGVDDEESVTYVVEVRLLVEEVGSAEGVNGVTVSNLGKQMSNSQIIRPTILYKQLTHLVMLMLKLTSQWSPREKTRGLEK